MVSSVGMGSFLPSLMRPPPSFEDFDADGDGALSVDEIESAGKTLPGGKSVPADKAQAFLQKLDTDGDGKVSKAEFTAFQSNIASEMHTALLQAQEHTHGHHHGHGGKGGIDVQKSFDALDTNQDGVVSPDELAAVFDKSNGAGSGQASKLFAAMDTNGDGGISKDETQSFADLVASKFGSNANARFAANCYGSTASLGAAPGGATNETA